MVIKIFSHCNQSSLALPESTDISAQWKFISMLIFLKKIIRSRIFNLPFLRRRRFGPTRTSIHEAKNFVLRHLPQSWRAEELSLRGDAAKELPFDLPRPPRPLHPSHRCRHSEGQLRHRYSKVCHQPHLKHQMSFPLSKLSCEACIVILVGLYHIHVRRNMCNPPCKAENNRKKNMYILKFFTSESFWNEFNQDFFRGAIRFGVFFSEGPPFVFFPCLAC